MDNQGVNDKAQGNASTYRIGAVSRLTGVPADTLRVWERRYSVVTPYRAESGTRLYGPEDVGRLTLIKRLVDRGDAISSVANLSLAQLRDRVSGADLPETEGGPGRPCRVAVLGASLSDRLRREGSALDGLELVGLYDGPAQFLAEVRDLAPDLVLFDYPTVQPEQAREIANLLVFSGATRGLMVYSFATRATLERLDARRVLARRAPIDVPELRRWCLTLHQAARTAGAHPGDGSQASELDIALPIPVRRFTDRELAQIATAATRVRCECPHHLVDLVSALAAFEAYSEECEIRHADDAALHAFLNASTARARSLMETALARVVAADGIPLDPDQAIPENGASPDGT
jgi:MerR family transcriptional regulator, light-induced transcriptional regulator